MDGIYNTPDVLGDTFARASDPNAPKHLEIDVERYQHFLDHLDADQRDEALRALWQIIVAFVDLGFGVHPMQQACGQLREGADYATDRTADAVASADQDNADKDHAPDT